MVHPIELAIRDMKPGDVAAVAAIERGSSQDPWSEKLFASEFEVNPKSQAWLVAERLNRTDRVKPELVGFGGLLYVEEAAHLMNLAVAPKLRRTRLGSTLLGALLTKAAKASVSEMTLEVRASNSAAGSLYEQFGFVREGTRPGYYPDGEDAIIYWNRDLNGQLAKLGGAQAGPVGR